MRTDTYVRVGSAILDTLRARGPVLEAERQLGNLAPGTELEGPVRDLLIAEQATGTILERIARELASTEIEAEAAPAAASQEG